MNNKLRGFTLIDLMIAVAIVGILSALAFPSYMSSVRKSNRADAKAELMEIAQRLQRCYTAYARFDDPNDQDRCAVYEQLEEGAQKIVTRGRGLYEIKLVDDGDADNDATTYLLEATPTAGLTQTKDDDCQKFQLAQNGIQTAFDKNNADSTDKCW